MVINYSGEVATYGKWKPWSIIRAEQTGEKNNSETINKSKNF